MGRIRVLVADSQRLVGQSLVRALESFQQFEIFQEMPITGPQVVDLAQLFQPDVIVLDYWIGEMEGPATIRRINSRAQNCAILVLSWFHGPKEIQESFRAGAVGFIPKSATLEQLVEAIDRAYAGETPVFAEEVGELIQRISQKDRVVTEIAERFQELTNREIFVLKALSGGGLVQEVANQLMIGEATLKAHIRNILKKTGAKSRSEAVALALYCGIIQI